MDGMRSEMSVKDFIAFVETELRKLALSGAWWKFWDKKKDKDEENVSYYTLAGNEVGGDGSGGTVSGLIKEE